MECEDLKVLRAVFPQCTSNKAAFDFSRCHCNKNCPSDFKTAANNSVLFRDLKAKRMLQIDLRRMPVPDEP